MVLCSLNRTFAVENLYTMRKIVLYIILLTLVLSACTSPDHEAMRQRLQYVSDCNRADTLFTARWLPTVDSLVSYFDPSSRSWTERFFSLPFREGAGVGSNDRMMAHYLQGRVHHDMGEAPQALECYQKAAEQADTTSADCDYWQLSRIHGQTARLFLTQNMPEHAIQELNAQSKYALIVKDSSSYVNSIGHMAEAYYEMQDFAKAMQLSHLAYEMHIKASEAQLAYIILRLSIMSALRCDSNSYALKNIQLYEERSGLVDSLLVPKPGHEIYYILKGNCLLAEGRPTDALKYFTRAKEAVQAPNMLVNTYDGLYRTYHNLHQVDSMAKYAVLYSQYNDSTTQQLRNKELQQLRVLYNYSSAQERAAQMEKRAVESKLLSTVLMFTFLFATLAVLFIMIAYGMRVKTKISKVNITYFSTLVQYLIEHMKLQVSLDQDKREKTDIEKHKVRINELKYKLSEYHGQQQDMWAVDEVLLSDATVISFHKMAILGKQPSPLSWNELRQSINIHLPGYIESIGKLADLDQKETNICLLVKLFFIPSEICTLLGIKPQALTNIRARMMGKMFGQNGGAKDFDRRIQDLSPSDVI